jgi:hypothetical protein
LNDAALLLDGLVEIGRRLAGYEVDYCLVGGFAVSVRARPRLTHDIDLAVLTKDDKQTEELIRALQRDGFTVGTILENSAAGRLATARLNVSRGREVDFVVDLLFASSGIEPEIVAGGEPLEVFPGLTLKVARREHLLAMKTLSADDETRPHDVDDLLALIKAASAHEIRAAESLCEVITARGYNRGRDLAQLLTQYRRRVKASD